MVRIEKAAEGDRVLLWNVFQKYLYEMSRYYDSRMDHEGNYPYRYFDRYFDRPDRHALLLYDGEELAGFAMINTHSVLGQKIDWAMAEFTIFPAWRKKGLGREAAKEIFRLFPGKWELKFSEKNSEAKRFWQTATAPYDPRLLSCGEEETALVFFVE